MQTFNNWFSFFCHYLTENFYFIYPQYYYTGVGPLVDMKVWDQMLMSTNGPMMVN